ncbi:MAG: alpha/beta hydrolase [Flavobacteriales bacterium]|nr:alpha/beta hydrolase [Flavobacteriales bacterium]
MLLTLVACDRGGATVKTADHDAPSTAADTAKSDPAAARPFVFGEVRTLRSTILVQDRTLNIYLPDGYSPDSATTYAVIYVLDGSAHEDFPHIAGLAQYMNMYDLLPKSIVVGIANVDRKHDFTYPTRNDSDKVWVPNSGGSAGFIRFIGEELQPFVDRTYKTNGKRTIIGQSLGGLVATEMLFKRPGLFDDYILVSPSVWWDNGSLADSAAAWTTQHASEPKRVFIAMASDDDMMQQQVDKVIAAFKANARPPLRWTYVAFPEETHATILHRAVYSAFEWMGKK